MHVQHLSPNATLFTGAAWSLADARMHLKSAYFHFALLEPWRTTMTYSTSMPVRRLLVLPHLEVFYRAFLIVLLSTVTIHITM